jgi:tetratricopeptide (TPR) repeat protein
MSELFSALQKLEKQNTLKAPQLPPLGPEAGKGGGKQKTPYLKSIVLFTLIMIIAVLGFLLLSSGQMKMFFLKAEQEKTVSPAPDYKEQPDILTTGETSLPVAADVEIKSVIETEEGGQPQIKNYPHVLAGTVSPESPTTLKKIAIIPMADAVALKISETRESSEDDLKKQLEELENALIEKQRIQTRQEFRGKRLLHRAEKLRREGRMAQALSLYKKAWHNNPTPAIANNIGAILIGMDSYKEAKSYLDKALRLAPGDQDILFNLTIAVQRQDRQAGER